MPNKKITLFALAAFIAILLSSAAINSQIPDYRKMLDPESKNASMGLIVRHLEESGTNQPIEELVRWACTGFPEFHNEHDHWHIDASGFHSRFEAALFIFMSEYPERDKGTRYLRLIEELKGYGQFTHQLTQNAYKFLTAGEMESEFYHLVLSSDPEERSRGFVMGWDAARVNREIAAVYLKASKSDPDLHPRYSALVTIAMSRSVYPREVALLGLDRLLNDTDQQVRTFGGIIVRQGADFGTVWTEKDIPRLLSLMLKATHLETRRALAMTIARLTTTDSTLYADENKWVDDPQEKFIAIVNAGREKAVEAPEGTLLGAWKEWWTPLIPKYMVKRVAIGCG